MAVLLVSGALRKQPFSLALSPGLRSSAYFCPFVVNGI